MPKCHESQRSWRLNFSGEAFNQVIVSGSYCRLQSSGISEKSPADVKKNFFTECRRRGIESKSGWKIFEMTGSRPGQEVALELIGHAGRLVVVGYGTESVVWHLSKLMVRDAEIHGTWGCPPEHYPFVLARVLAGDIQIGPLVKTRPMSGIASTFEEGRINGNPGKRIVLVPDFEDSSGVHD